MNRQGTWHSPIRLSKWRCALGGTETRIREGPSPKSVRSARPRDSTSISAPTASGPLMHASASAPGRPRRLPPGGRQILAPTEADRVRPDQGDAIPCFLEPLGGAPAGVLQEPGHADHRGGKDRLPLSLIVKGDVAAHHRDFELPAGGRGA